MPGHSGGTTVTNGGEPFDGRFLYNPSLLEGLEPLEGQSVPPVDPPLKVRPLRSDDFDRGFLQLLSQLTAGGDVSREDFLRRFEEMRSIPNTYHVIVVEDMDRGAVVAAASLITELKFIRNLASRGRLEDVVVSSEYRGKQLGKLLVQTVVMLARRLGCYKVTLDCKDALVKFYAGNGFILEPGNSNMMSLRFPEASTSETTADSH